jgi:hypothetical protein
MTDLFFGALFLGIVAAFLLGTLVKDLFGDDPNDDRWKGDCG